MLQDPTVEKDAYGIPKKWLQTKSQSRNDDHIPLIWNCGKRCNTEPQLQWNIELTHWEARYAV